MFPVDFYQHFLKSENSTKIPPPVGLRTLQCCLKEETSVLSPVLLLDFTGEDPTILTYARIPIFQNRYYFVQDWINVRGNLWEAHLSVDVLASWKSTIGDTEQFIERSQSASDLNLIDSLAMGKSNVTTQVFSQDSPWGPGVTDSIVVEIMGASSSVYYIFTFDEFQIFLGALFSDVYLDTVMPGWIDLYPQLKAEINPMQFIGSVRYYPCQLHGSYIDTIDVGFGHVNCSAQMATLLGATQEWFFNVTFPVHPQASEFAFTRSAPFTSYEIFFPPFGSIPIDPALIRVDSTPQCDLKIDFASGMGNLKIINGAYGVMAEANSQIGVDIKVGQTYNTTPGLGNVVTDGISIVASALTGNYAGAAAGVASTVENYLGDMTPKLRTSGSNGTLCNIYNLIQTQGRFQIVKPPDPTRVGYLLYDKRVIKTLNGFIQTSNAHVETFGMVTEDRRIESLMNGGFYYE